MSRARASVGHLVSQISHVLMRSLVFGIAFGIIIAVGALIQTKVSSQPVTRIAMNQVPVEKVVDFGHEDGEFAVQDLTPAQDPVPVSETKQNPEIGPADKPQLAVAPNLPRRSVVAPDANGVLPIAFSLEGGGTAGVAGLGVEKTIALEQGAVSGIKIFIVGDALIEVERQELARALNAIGAQAKAETLPDAGRSGRLTLDRVRHAGVDLRYDAIRDRLILRP